MRYMQGDFLCLREVTLSYNVPRRIINRYFMNNLRINVTGHNLHYFTIRELTEAHGIDQAYPNTRTITLVPVLLLSSNNFL